MDCNAQLAAISSLKTFKAVTWDMVRTATRSDPDSFQLCDLIERGFPEQKNDVPIQLQEYHQFRKHLWTIDGVIMYKNHIIIPPKLRKDILSSLHAAHQGISTMTSRAENSVFWPGLTKCIKSLRDTCSDCNRIAPSQPSAPPTPPMIPAYPFQCICVDCFKHLGIN